MRTAVRTNYEQRLSGKARRRIGGALRVIAIAVVLAVPLVRIIWMVIASFRTSLDIADSSRFLTGTLTMQNYESVAE